MGSYSIINFQILKDVFDTVMMFSLDQWAIKVEAHKITEGCHQEQLTGCGCDQSSHLKERLTSHACLSLNQESGLNYRIMNMIVRKS